MLNQNITFFCQDLSRNWIFAFHSCAVDIRSLVISLCTEEMPSFMLVFGTQVSLRSFFMREQKLTMWYYHRLYWFGYEFKIDLEDMIDIFLRRYSPNTNIYNNVREAPFFYDKDWMCCRCSPFGAIQPFSIRLWTNKLKFTIPLGHWTEQANLRTNISGIHRTGGLVAMQSDFYLPS